MKKIIDFIRSLDSRDQAVLATIVKVEGSAYRREGAKMIMTRLGKQWGTLSAGCLEEDLQLKIPEVLDQGKAQIYIYDTTSEDDLSWGMGSGCNGKIHILVEPIGWNTVLPLDERPYLPRLDKVLDKRISMVAAKCLGNTKAPLSATLFVTEEEQCFGTLGDAQTDAIVMEHCISFLQSGEKSKSMAFAECGVDVFFDRYTPKDRLFIFGAGPDAEPVVDIAACTGFEITVIDPRPIRCNCDIFAKASHHLVEHPKASLQQLEIGKQDYVIVMTHNFNRDKELLEGLIPIHPYYLGILGPRKRTKRLLETDEIPASIHSPIGLDIGSEGPDEIAVSIVAELIQARRKGSIKK